MIPPTIALSIAGVVIALLAIIVYIVIRESTRQARLKNAAYKEQARAMADIDTLGAENSRLREEHTDISAALETTKALYNKVLRERNELQARSTALQEALEAKPTLPKRTVRKNSTAGGDAQ